VQLNTLNRVISLFLIGGFVVVLSAVLLREEIAKKVDPFFARAPSRRGLEPMAGVLLTVGLLSATALAGAIVDALGNLTVRRFITKILSKDRFLAGLFWCAGEFDEYESWRKTFEAALENNRKHESLVGKPGMMKPLSAGIFFRTADKEHVEWLVQHHSMYHLTADFVVILLIGAVLAFVGAIVGAVRVAWQLDLFLLALTCASVAAAYLLMTFALDHFLYSYQLTFRNAYLALKDEEPHRVPDPSRGTAAPQALKEETAS